MRLLTFDHDGALRLGVATEHGVLDVAVAATRFAADAARFEPTRFLASGTSGLEKLRGLVANAAAAAPAGGLFLDEASLRIGPCVPAPGKIVCVGLNYLRHARESGMAAPVAPVLFSKFANAVAASGEGVPLPEVGVEYDYEAELVAVIGQRAKNVSVADALDHVLGYCNGNDVSARDLQMLSGQWLLGKTLDGFMPLGPYLVTADEAGDVQDMHVQCWLNGELRQDSNTSDMIFGVAEVISYASRYMTLEPGDVISTGTPEGVILGMTEKRWMKPGDEVVVEVGRLGRLVNPMVGAS